MEKIEINSDVLEQIERQLNFSYSAIGVMAAISGIIVTLAIVVVGYQLTINKKIINELKEENKKSIENVTAPIFVYTVSQMIRMGAYGINDIENLVGIYLENFKGNEEVRKIMETLKIRFIEGLKNKIMYTAPTGSEMYEEIKLNVDFNMYLNSVEKDIQESEILSLNEKENKIKKLRDYHSEFMFINVLYKKI